MHCNSSLHKSMRSINFVKRWSVNCSLFLHDFLSLLNKVKTSLFLNFHYIFLALLFWYSCFILPNMRTSTDSSIRKTGFWIENLGLVNCTQAPGQKSFMLFAATSVLWQFRGLEVGQAGGRTAGGKDTQWALWVLLGQDAKREAPRISHLPSWGSNTSPPPSQGQDKEDNENSGSIDACHADLSKHDHKEMIPTDTYISEVCGNSG